MPELSNPADREKQTVLINASHGPSLIRFRGKMIEAMIAHGYRVHASGPGIDDELAHAIRDLGAVPHSITLTRTGLDPIADLRYFRDIRRLLRKTGADLCLSYTIKPNIWASLAARSLGVRSVSMVTGVGYAFIENGGLRQKLVKLVARLLYRAATNANDVVIFQNPDDRDDFVETGCLAEAGKARMINGSGVDLNYYAPPRFPIGPYSWSRRACSATRASANMPMRPLAFCPDGATRGSCSRAISTKGRMASTLPSSSAGSAAGSNIWARSRTCGRPLPVPVSLSCRPTAKARRVPSSRPWPWADRSSRPTCPVAAKRSSTA